MLFLPFHAAVLEPDFDLSLAEAKRVGDFDPSSSGEISVEVELFFQLKDLVARVGRPCSLAIPVVRAIGTRYRQQKKSRTGCKHPHNSRRVNIDTQTHISDLDEWGVRNPRAIRGGEVFSLPWFTIWRSYQSNPWGQRAIYERVGGVLPSSRSNVITLG